MFTLTKEPTAWIDIEWTGLDAEGFTTAHAIRMQVRLLPLSECTSLFEGNADEATAELIKRVARDWSGVHSEDGKDLEMTPDHIDMMVEMVPNFARGFQASYLKAWLGDGPERPPAEEKAERA